MIDMDIFSTLEKYSSAENKNAQDENYLTEAFVFLLKLLLEKDKEKGIELLNLICTDGEFLFELEEELSIRTQTGLESKDRSDIPDIQIRSDDKLVFIEVKLDAGLSGEDQIEKYVRHLSNVKKFNSKKLDRKSTRLNSSHSDRSRMPSSA